MATVTQLPSETIEAENLSPLEIDGVLYIGRGLENDLVLAYPRVSRKHAKIVKEGNQYVLYDLNSANGTFVNDVPTSQRVLKTKEIVTVGNIKLEFIDEAGEISEQDHWILNKFGTFLHRYQKRENSMIAFLQSIESVKKGLKAMEDKLSGDGQNGDGQTGEGTDQCRQDLLLYTSELNKIYEIADKIHHQQRSQNIVLEIANLISPVFDLAQLLKISLDIMLKVLEAERGYILIQEEDKLVPRVARTARTDIADLDLDSISWSIVEDSAESGRTILIVDTSLGDDADSRGSIVAHNIKSILCTPFAGKGELKGVVYLDRRKGLAAFSDNDRHMIQTIANQMAVTIENTQFYADFLENQAIRNELEVARSIQYNLLPQTLPDTEHLKASAKLVFAKEVGGDYYDLFITDDGRYVSAMADVCGKGIPASLVASSVRAYIRSLVYHFSSPAEILKTLNNLFYKELTPGYFVTLVLLIFEPQTRTLTYAKAGHEHPIYLDSQNDDFKLLTCSGIPLGFYENVDYKEESLTINHGDTCILHTDGITDAQKKDRTKFGRDRFYDLIKANKDLSADALVQLIFKEVDGFSEDHEAFDDVTLMVMDFL